MRQSLSIVTLLFCSVLAVSAGKDWVQSQKNLEAKLIEACQEGNRLMVVKQVCHLSTETDEAQVLKNKALLEAAKYNQFEIVEYLLKNGAQPTAKDSFKQTALLWAVVNRNAKIVCLLIRYGADPHVEDGIGRTAFLIAQRNNDWLTQQVLEAALVVGLNLAPVIVDVENNNNNNPSDDDDFDLNPHPEFTFYQL